MNPGSSTRSRPRRRGKRALLAIAVMAATAPETIPAAFAEPGCAGISVSPGQRLQRLIDRNAEGATFCLAAGTYVLRAPLRPKAGQRFVSIEPRKAVLTGRRVAGSFAFNGAGAPRVELRGLVIRDFAAPDRGGYAAVKASRGWRIIDNQIGPNIHSGIYHEAYAIVRGNTIQGNTVTGIGGFRAFRSLIVDNVIAYNGRSLARYRAAGGKWTRSIGLVIRRNIFQHNWAVSLWLDIDNLDPLIEDNIIQDNAGKGILYEISCPGMIRRNLVEDNRLVGISIVASRGVSVVGNHVARNGDGIQVSHQDRTAENTPRDNCRWVTGRVRVRENEITMTRGETGLWVFNVADGDAIFRDGRVRFVDNHYRIGADVTKPFLWLHRTRTWLGWRRFGQDTGGSLLRL
jgi:parallel beta helix pectate lyase-like protein